MDEVTLTAVGEEARNLLMRHEYSELASQFGYALSFERAPSAAIEADFLSAAASPHAVATRWHLPIIVRYFAPNDTGLFAVVECSVPVADGAAVLLELIVTGWGNEKNITVEDISGVAV
jgi:hypothetical protein